MMIWQDDAPTHAEATRGWLFMSVIIVIVTLLVLCFCAISNAQTLTNADLGKKLHLPPAPIEVYESLKAHEFRLPAAPARGPYVASTHTSDPTSGPWSWPAERTWRRLDNTYVDMPPTVYGVTPFYGGYAWHSGYPSVIVHPATQQQQRRSDRDNHNQVIRRR